MCRCTKDFLTVALGNIFFKISYQFRGEKLEMRLRKEEENKNERTTEISNRDNPSTMSATENLHLRVLGDAGGSR